MFFFLTLLDDPEEQQKFTEIYYQYRHFLWYVANQKLQDAHLAEDAVQEAFLALTRHMDKIEDVHSDRARNFLATNRAQQGSGYFAKKSAGGGAAGRIWRT